jgi:DNA (cytosine-5)-methyltransferase 1
MTNNSDNLGLDIWSLFSGIGGLELGLEWAGLGETSLQCEIEKFPLEILEKHWPDAVRINDVRKIKKADLPGSPNIICGGFPCQPHSLAGKRKGASDDRHLWPEFARIIDEYRPDWVVAENVPGIRSNGALLEVLTDLADVGYDAEWIRLSAAAVGAPHLRERIFIVAYPGSAGRSEIASSPFGNEKANGRGPQENHVFDGHAQGDPGRHYPGSSAHDSDSHESGRSTDGEPHSGSEETRRASGDHSDGLRAPLADASGEGLQGRVFTETARTALPIPPRETQWSTEPDVGRVAHGIPRRVDRLKALGNAVVPECAYFVGACIRSAIERERGI